MKEFVWRFYAVCIFFPALLIGAVLSFVMLPIVIGWMTANQLFDLSRKRIEKEA